MEISLVDINTVIIPPIRHRRVFVERDIKDLARSIQKIGLLHPPLTRADGKTLLVGERRIRAIKLLYTRKISISFNTSYLPIGYIPIVKVDPKSELQAFELELHKTLYRVDLTWKEKKAAANLIKILRETEIDK